MLTNLLVSAILCSAAAVSAIPFGNQKRSGVTPVPASVETSYTPYENFAAAAYCINSGTWAACGATCAANPNFVLHAVGGDGDATPHWYVGWSSALSSIVIAHEGTDPTEFLSLLDDAEILTTQPPTSLFPGIPSTVYVHSGFLSTFESSLAAILTEVKALVTSYATTTVTVVGHSLGGAIANLEGVSLKLLIPTLTVKIITFGEPRVGNPAWADYLNAYDITRITHNYDPIPIVPGRALGFQQPDGEIHIDDNDVWNYCAGEDNTDVECSTGATPNIFVSDILDHLGPYGPSQVWMGTIYC
ncbi:hypothetical protein FRB94_009800 [Tulasnella sp. JGI-2019a]|nr:hypothetical protein FRB94_009800 [Tulasnella sp. JGI-2019a]